LTLEPAAVAFLNDLLRDTRESPEALFRKALGLYRGVPTAPPPDDAADMP
jgi:hypothetical protein